jgi:hypothetical protein
MRSWQSKTLRALESGTATLLAVALVCLDMVLQLK